MPRLVLSPVDCLEQQGSQLSLQELLQRLGMTGETWPGRNDRYLIGKDFLSQVSFMGCAPAIELEPPVDGSEDFLHVEISHSSSWRFFEGINMVARCPLCRARLTEWQQLAQQWDEGNISSFHCPRCKQTVPPQQLDWKTTAGFACDAVIIHGIYPQEAVPTESLLQKLQQLSGEAWHYFYAR